MAAFGFIWFLPAVFLFILLRFQPPDKPPDILQGLRPIFLTPQLLRNGSNLFDKGASDHHTVGKPGKVADMLLPGDAEPHHDGSRRAAPYFLKEALHPMGKAFPPPRRPQGRNAIDEPPGPGRDF